MRAPFALRSSTPPRDKPLVFRSAAGGRSTGHPLFGFTTYIVVLSGFLTPFASGDAMGFAVAILLLPFYVLVMLAMDRVVRRVVIDGRGVTIRWADNGSRQAATIRPHQIDGVEVRRWFTSAGTLDLLGPKLARHGDFLTLRLRDGRFVRLAPAERHRRGPLARWLWVRRRWGLWRRLRDDTGRPLRWTADRDDWLCELLERRLAKPTAWSEQAAASEVASADLWRFVDAQWVPGPAADDAVRAPAISVPLVDGAPAAERTDDPVSFTVDSGGWGRRPGRERTTIGRSGVTLRDPWLRAAIPMELVDGFEVRHWRPADKAGPSVHRVTCVAARLHDGRFVRLTGLTRSASGATVMVRRGVLGTWTPWNQPADAGGTWQAATDAALLAELEQTLQHFRELKLPCLMVPQADDETTPGPQPWDVTLGHLIDRRGVDGKPARSQELRAA